MSKEILTLNSQTVIGMVHCLPLPTTAGFDGDYQRIIDRAVQDAVTLEKAGVDAVIVENMGDTPFSAFLNKAQVAALTAAAYAVKQAVQIPVGLDAAFNDCEADIAIAAMVGASFIRVPVFVDTVLFTDGIIQPCAKKCMEYRKMMGQENVKILADVQVKHAHMLREHITIEQSAKDAASNGADGIIVTGTQVGEETPLDLIKRVKNVVEKGRKIKMMRPMKLAGSELMFGEGSLAYIKTIKAKKVSIVIGGHSMEKSGMLAKVEGYFKETGAETMVIRGVEPDPSFETVLRGRNEMLEFEPDLIVGLGGGSAMDAAKAMWIFYEHPELTQMEDILPPNEFPKLRGKARMCCIPSTSGTASEVSRSIVISDNEKGLKHGVGNMEMMPDIAICDPEVTMSMPAKITAETGMDALTHALEALASNRANYLSDILASQAAQDIMETLPTAYENGNDIKARETMVQASMVAGIAFTNVSLGIVHSMAHTIGGIFHVSHGLADAIILPYIRYNEQNETAKEVYAKFAKRIGAENLHEAVEALNEKLNIPKCFKEIIPDEEKYMAKLDEMAPLAKADGCTKTNPVIPEIDEFKELFIKVYRGE